METKAPDSMTCDYGEAVEHDCYRLDLGGGGGIFLCRYHWGREMEWRKERNKELEDFAKFDILPWPGDGA